MRLLREADPGRPLTLGHHDPLLAALSANRRLDFVSWHRYPPPGLLGQADQRIALHALRALFPDRPIVLGEFGHRSTDIGEARAAVEETATVLQLAADGFAGGLKWMLTDTRDGTDSMGLFRMDGSAKPVVAALRSVARYSGHGTGPVARLELAEDGEGGLCYVVRAGRSLLLGGTCPAPVDAGVAAVPPVQLVVGWSESAVEVSAAAAARVALGPSQLVGGTRGGRWILEDDGASETATLRESDGTIGFEVRPGRIYRLRPEGGPSRAGGDVR